MTVNTVTVGPGLFTIGEDAGLTNFSAQVTSCKVTPAVTKGDPIPVLSGEEVAGDRTETFTVSGELLQDLGAVTSRVEWLWAHRGEAQPFEYVPATSAGKKITGTLTVEAVELGGDVKAKARSSFTFDCVGAPLIEDVE